MISPDVVPEQEHGAAGAYSTMTETFQILILLLAVISLVGVIAKRLQIPAAILLVITGVVLALIPGLPSLQLAPDLVLLLILPPVIYWDAVKMSWKEYRFAVMAVSAGSFSFVAAGGSFIAIVAGEIVWGIGVGWLMLRLRRWVRDPSIEIMLSILTPFMAYWPPSSLAAPACSPL